MQQHFKPLTLVPYPVEATGNLEKREVIQENKFVSRFVLYSRCTPRHIEEKGLQMITAALSIVSGPRIKAALCNKDFLQPIVSPYTDSNLRDK